MALDYAFYNKLSDWVLGYSRLHFMSLLIYNIFICFYSHATILPELVEISESSLFVVSIADLSDG